MPVIDCRNRFAKQAPAEEEKTFELEDLASIAASLHKNGESIDDIVAQVPLENLEQFRTLLEGYLELFGGYEA